MKQTQNKKVYSKTLPPVDLRPPEEITSKVANRDAQTKVTEFKTLPEQVAKSTLCYKNWYVEELRDRYKHFDRMKRIDLVFPYAKLGENAKPCMILIDQPKNETELEMCLRKAKVLKGLGYRYAIVEADSSLFDVLEQLGAV